MRYHIYLACVEVTFVDNEGESGVTRVNSMIKANTQRVGVEHLARAQQGAQIQLIEKLNDPQLNIINAVFVNISYLGHQTEEEFQKRSPVQQEARMSSLAPMIQDA